MRTMNDMKETLGKGPWYYGWNVVAAAILSQSVCNSLCYNSLSLFLKPWSADLHAPVSYLLLSITAMIVVASPISPLIGMLADRYFQFTRHHGAKRKGSLTLHRQDSLC